MSSHNIGNIAKSAIFRRFGTLHVMSVSVDVPTCRGLGRLENCDNKMSLSYETSTNLELTPMTLRNLVERYKRVYDADGERPF